MRPVSYRMARSLAVTKFILNLRLHLFVSITVCEPSTVTVKRTGKNVYSSASHISLFNDP